MKKILLSVATLVAVGVIAAGATGAFFGDAETSTGNTFTAGSIDLTVSSKQSYNGNVCTDGNWVGYESYPTGNCTGAWALADLGVEGVTHKFFNFDDIKPGDHGASTVGLKVGSNDAWACADIEVTKNDDVSSTGPELKVDVADDASNYFDGELAQNVHLTTWSDTNGNNVWESGETLIFQNRLASLLITGDNPTVSTFPIADSTTGGVPLVADADPVHIGLAWCAGTQTVNMSDHTITCDGSTMGNITQTDSMEADITFRVEQSRHNDGFMCIN